MEQHWNRDQSRSEWKFDAHVSTLHAFKWNVFASHSLVFVSSFFSPIVSFVLLARCRNFFPFHFFPEFSSRHGQWRLHAHGIPIIIIASAIRCRYSRLCYRISFVYFWLHKIKMTRTNFCFTFVSHSVKFKRTANVEKQVSLATTKHTLDTLQSMANCDDWRNHNSKWQYKVHLI